MNTNRIEAFSDGVMAILITIMVLELKAPHDPISDDLYACLRKQFSAEQLMQLSAQIAFENYRARWNRVFDVESDHIYCPA